MVGEAGYDHRLTQAFADTGISFIAKNTNANTITHIVPEKSDRLDECVSLIRQRLPGAAVRIQPIGMVCVIGTNMRIPGLLCRAAQALAAADIYVLGLDQALRQINMQFFVGRDDFGKAIRELHREFVET